RRLKPAEGPSHFLGIEQAEEAAEAVVARAPCGRSTIWDSSASFATAKSAMSTQVLAPHNVAASATNSIAAKSCRALRIANLAKNGDQRLHHRLPSNQEASSESTSSSNATALIRDSPALRPPFPSPRTSLRRGRGANGGGRIARPE